MALLVSELPVMLCGVILSCPALDQHHIPAAFNVQAIRYDGLAVILDLEREEFGDDLTTGGLLPLGSRYFQLILRTGQEPLLCTRVA